jgi:hypothetical protein
MILGILLAAALFFNSAPLLNINYPTSSNSTIYTGNTVCINQSLELNCTSNFSVNYNLSSQNGTFPQLITLCCLIPFVLISIVIIVDSFKYLTNFLQYSNTLTPNERLSRTLRDLTILPFIAPFIVIVANFTLMMLLGWSYYPQIYIPFIEGVLVLFEILILLSLLAFILDHDDFKNKTGSFVSLSLLGLLAIGGLFAAILGIYFNQFFIGIIVGFIVIILLVILFSLKK